MPSPTVLIVGLVILWIIVVGPMIVRRPSDARSRSVRRAAESSETESTSFGAAAGSGAVDADAYSQARRRMAVRRRRSLFLLVGAAVVSTVLAVVVGGLLWLLAVASLAGVTAYLCFLRVQARRARRAAEAQQAATQRLRAVPTPMPAPAAVPPPSNVVAIDDDDLALDGMDTIDLTGLYDEAATAMAERRAG